MSLAFVRSQRDGNKKSGGNQILKDLKCQEKALGVYIVGNKGNVLSKECYDLMGLGRLLIWQQWE